MLFIHYLQNYIQQSVFLKLVKIKMHRAFYWDIRLKRGPVLHLLVPPSCMKVLLVCLFVYHKKCYVFHNSVQKVNQILKYLEKVSKVEIQGTCSNMISKLQNHYDWPVLYVEARWGLDQLRPCVFPQLHYPHLYLQRFRRFNYPESQTFDFKFQWAMRNTQKKRSSGECKKVVSDILDEAFFFPTDIKRTDKMPHSRLHFEPYSTGLNPKYIFMEEIRCQKTMK